MKVRSSPIIIMGLSSILLQIISLRQLLTVFSGNELDIGITLSVWLTSVGAGSYAGYRLKSKYAFGISFVVVAFLSQPTILFINLIRPVISAGFGETISLTMTLISTSVSLLPLCLVVGMQFPLAVSYAKENTARVYALEAVGAFTGGVLFTLLLSGRVDVFILSMAVSIMNLAAAMLLIRKKSLALLLLIPVIFYFSTAKINTALQWKGTELISRTESRYGEITVLKIRDEASIYASGRFQFSYPDPQTEELKTHLPMSIHSSPSSILVVGGSPAVLREFLKYPVSGIAFVEIDPAMINISFRLLEPADRERLNDKRLKIITEDARRFIKKLHAPAYDLIVLNLPEPSTANINRFYTSDFFKEARATLRKDGIISLSLPTSSGYISRRMQMANGSIYNSLKDVFRYVEVSSEEYGYAFASNSQIDIRPHTLYERFAKSAINTNFFRPYILNDAFSPLKTAMVRERLEKITAVNRDMQPVAYLYNLMLWADIHGGRMLNYLLGLNGWQIISIFIASFIAMAVVLRRKKQPVYYSMFTTGFSAMSFSIIIMLTYQTSFGYVYEMIGLLTALFMIGLATGAHIIKNIANPLRWLRSFEAVTIVLLISAPLFFKKEISFYLLSLLCGMIAGVQFVTANLCMKEQDRIRVAGRLYATDLIGSFSGAFITSVLFIPLLGIQNAIFSLVFLKVISLGLLLSIRKG